jgi:hypothetical protein
VSISGHGEPERVTAARVSSSRFLLAFPHARRGADAGQDFRSRRGRAGP